MANQLFEVEGFDELNKLLKRLPDNVKRTEVLKIQRRLAKPIVQAYRSKLPIGSRKKSRTTKTRYSKRTGALLSTGDRFDYTPGNLRRSTKVVTVPKSISKNPSIVVRPTSPRGKLKTKSGKTRDDGYYRFMVVRKGFTGSGRGSRKGSNTVVPQARDATLAATQARATKEAEVKTANYIQKQIDKLST